jgi:hypothetical protein
MKTSILTAATLALVFAVIPFAAQAYSTNNVELGLSLLKFDRETSGPTLGDATEKWTLYDLKLGYVFQNNVYLGGIYSAYKDDTGGSSNTRDMLGASVGYHNEGWFIDGSYLFQAKLDWGGATLKDGSGYAIDVGYNTMMGTNFYLGLQASYKSISYSQRDGVSETNKEKSELYPMLNLGLMF